MASRRTRIKGIANIPQRRKTTVANDDQTTSQVEPEEAKENTNLTFNIDKIPEDKEICLQPQHSEVNTPELLDTDHKASYHTREKASVGHLSIVPDPINRLEQVSGSNADNSTSVNELVKPTDTLENIANLEPTDNSKIKNVIQNGIKPNYLVRRKHIKPAISANVINRNLKEKAEGVTKTEKAIKVPEQVNEKEVCAVISTEQSIPSQKNTLETISSQIENQQQEHESVTTSHKKPENYATLDELHLSSQTNKIKPETPLDNARKPSSFLNINNTFDNEYPPPPPSPSKINRSRIKAIPRLSYRKTSFSASESEDESRRNYNRNRNDSMCSTTSGVTESITECMSPQRPKELGSVIQKKCSRTEQSRKLAEARRDFQRRFGSNTPDRHRLTMIDLIFYNPSTNPMNSEETSKQSECNEENVDDPSKNESENVDDPMEPKEQNEDENKSDEENEMPVPQIKIGPSGEIILDEKSLVIESKEVKKQREELQKTRLVNGDYNTSYGIYKKQKRSKFWTQSETLRFYKALNTIGTDFAFMCELFPRRTRRELKMKFKKEEKINSALINRAITQPCNFDFMTLKHEVEMEERELEELEKLKEDEAKLRKQRMEEKLSKKRKAVKDQEMEDPPVKKQVKPQRKRKANKPKLKKLSIENVLDDSDADVSDIATQSESDDEISMPLKPTRSGRVPKLLKKFDYTEITSVDNIVKSSRVCDANVDTDNIEPGSIMILTERGANSEPVYKIYMVTPDQNATPLNLTSDVISKAVAFKKGLTAQNIMTISANNTDDEDNTIEPENNVTIPADESVITLRGDKGVFELDVKEEHSDDSAYERNGVVS